MLIALCNDIPIIFFYDHFLGIVEYRLCFLFMSVEFQDSISDGLRVFDFAEISRLSIFQKIHDSSDRSRYDRQIERHRLYERVSESLLQGRTAEEIR